jgi:hypothetical protein
VCWTASRSGGFKSLWRSDKGRHIQRRGNTSPAGCAGKENPKRARSRKRRTRPRGGTYPGTEANQGNRRAGRPPRGGVRKACGEVPGRNRGSDAMMNRSAQGGTRSSPHYGGEGVLIHPPHQGVCGRHGTEDSDVTPGELAAFPTGSGDKRPYKPQGEKGSDASPVVGRPHSTRSAVKAA